VTTTPEAAPTTPARTATADPSASEGTPVPGRTTSPLLTRFAVGLLLVMATAKGLSPFREPDLWWHLRMGDWIRQTHDLTATDPITTFGSREYVATQWLPEVVTSAAYSAGGVGAVLWLRTLAILLMTLAVFVMCRRYAGRLPASVAAGLTLIGAGAGMNPRPQLVSFVLFAITLHAWCGMARDHRPRWWLVPVFWLWAASHGLWTFGLALSVLMLVSIAADPTTRPRPREMRRLAVLVAACLVAVAATPIGPGLLATPFQVAGNASMIAEEWRPTPLNNVFSWAALVELLLVVVIWSLRPARRPWWQLALLGFAALATLWMWRLVPLGVIAASPLLAGALQETLSARREGFSRGERRTLVLGCVALLAVGGLVCASPRGSGAAREPGPMGQVGTALTALPARTVVLDDFGISGWLSWAHPDLTPVADLRGEIYAPAYLTSYRKALAVEPGWQSFVDSTGSQVALLQDDSALADALTHRLHWTTIATSKDFVLLRRPSP
jgi:hypothetical protein